MIQKVEELEADEPLIGFSTDEVKLIKGFLEAMLRKSDDSQGLEGRSAAEAIDLLHSDDEGDRDLIVACLTDCREVISKFLCSDELL